MVQSEIEEIEDGSVAQAEAALAFDVLIKALAINAELQNNAVEKPLGSLIVLVIEENKEFGYG